ncbi:MAG: pentapeptide repeat-containing protein [Cyclobacteriaceae bacterium]
MTHKARERFRGIDFSKVPLHDEYNDCTFETCKFASVDLSDVKFVNCDFVACDLSNVKSYNTAWQDVRFRNCKMMGIQFDESNALLMELSFDQCQLDYSSFYKRKLKKTFFLNSTLRDADLAEADLSEARFDHSDLGGALFSGTNLNNADLSSAYNYSIDPGDNIIKQAKFSMPAVIGLLDKFDIKINS